MRKRWYLNEKNFTVSWLGAVCITLVSVFFISRNKDTVDFRGVVISVYESGEDNCFYLTATSLMNEGLNVKIKAGKDISVKEITGEKMTVYDIEVGNIIDLDYKGKIDGNNSIVEAKWLKVCKTAINTENQ